MLEEVKELAKHKEEKMVTEVDRLLGSKELDNADRRNLQVLRKYLGIYLATYKKGMKATLAVKTAVVRSVRNLKTNEDLHNTFNKEFEELDMLLRAIHIGMFPVGTIGYEKVQKVLEENCGALV
ncbi:hypothetical protein [Bacillus thuringiensis]|uniref:hypothetical protein n=1 Tax=Bacillus thuringiensis TaxID=1428 RepID=UPI000BFC0F49|nr:hypothetical protein [Bacillus thuringiensis]PGT90082.1 hypothetical protein COD17_10050 [Bacillus thuringiensis]